MCAFADKCKKGATKESIVFYSLFVKIQVKTNAADIFHTDNIFQKRLLQTILQINLKLNNRCFMQACSFFPILSAMFKTIGNNKYTAT